MLKFKISKEELKEAGDMVQPYIESDWNSLSEEEQRGIAANLVDIMLGNYWNSQSIDSIVGGDNWEHDLEEDIQGILEGGVSADNIGDITLELKNEEFYIQELINQYSTIDSYNKKVQEELFKLYLGILMDQRFFEEYFDDDDITISLDDYNYLREE